MGAVRRWVVERVPDAWRDAAARGGTDAIRAVRSRAEYEAWYPTFGGSGLVVPTWPPEFGGLGGRRGGGPRDRDRPRPVQPGPPQPARAEPVRARRCSRTAPTSSGAGSCPRSCGTRSAGASCSASPAPGSDLASLATRAVRDGDEWRVTGQKVWTTWAHRSDYAVLLARTDPGRAEAAGHHLLPASICASPASRSARCGTSTGEVDFNAVFLDGARVPDDQRVGGGRRRVAGGERHPGLGTPDGRRAPARAASTASAAPAPTTWCALARRAGRADDPVVRQRLGGPRRRGADPGVDEPAGPRRRRRDGPRAPRAASARSTRAS